MSHFFAYIARMKDIRRWSLMRNTTPENDLEHAAQVAIIAHSLAVLTNKYYGGSVDENKVSSLALYHDASEVITGDMATPIKYFNPGIASAYKDIELAAQRKLLDMLPESLRPAWTPLLSPDTESAEWRIVKAADCLAAYLKCVEELKAGNGEFRKAAGATCRKALALSIPAVDHFVREFAPSFGLTLDELN